MSGYVRIWTEVEPAEIISKTLFVDDLYGNCGNCKEVGLNFLKNATCPNCGTEFEYLSSNLKNTAEVIKILKRIKKEGLGFQVVERDDLDKANAKDALGDLFEKPGPGGE